VTEGTWIALIGVLTVVFKGKYFWGLTEKYIFHGKEKEKEEENKVHAILQVQIDELKKKIVELEDKNEKLEARVRRYAVKSRGRKHG
jgi:hypothetical protein